MDKNNPSKIILPPRELFKNKQSRLSEKVGNSDYHYDLERAEIVTDHGSRLFFKGMKFPIKGWPYMEAIFVCNIVKRQTMMIAFSLARKELPQDARIDCAAEMLEDLCFANLRRAFAGTQRPETMDVSAMAERLSVQIGFVVAGLKA